MKQAANSLLNWIDKLLTRRRIAYAWIVGGALWLGWLISLLLGANSVDLAGNALGPDFIPFYTAGTIVRIGEEQNLYDFNYQFELQKQVIGDHLDKFRPFVNPPIAAWFFAPLSLFPYPWSFGLWSLASLAALYAGIRFLPSLTPHKTVALSLTWLPVFASISFGQNGLLSFFLLSIIYALWVRKKDWLAGISAGLMLYKPQLILGMGLFWLLTARKNWKALAGFGVSAIVLSGLCIWLLPNATADYLQVVQNILPGLSTEEGFAIWHSRTFQSFWELLIPNQPGLSKILALVLAAAGVFYFIMLLKTMRLKPPLLFGAALILTFWITPYAMTYDLVLLLVPAILFWEHMMEARRRLRPLYALFWLATLLSIPLTFGQLQLLNFAVQVDALVLIFASYVLYHTVVEVSTDAMSTA